ncbi:MAG: hypothetical protein AAGD07_24625 [Planctomycetota bacterium]
MTDLVATQNYDTAAKIAPVVGIEHYQTLQAAMARRDEPLDVQELHGGRLIVSVESARQWAASGRQPGPKPQASS